MYIPTDSPQQPTCVLWAQHGEKGDNPSKLAPLSEYIPVGLDPTAPLGSVVCSCFGLDCRAAACTHPCRKNFSDLSTIQTVASLLDNPC